MFRETLLSALALYEYDRSVFDDFRVPQSFFVWDKATQTMKEVKKGVDIETAKDSILYQTAELSLATASSPDMLKGMIKLWTDKNFSVWQELWNTLNYTYNPIYNYDREEHGKDKTTERHVETPDITTKDDFERKLKDEADSNQENKVAAFNDGLADSDTSHTHGVNDATGTTHNTNKRTGTLKNDADDILQHDFHAFGNIGVTTTQDMINQQRELVQFNLIDYIVQDFKEEFCILIY